MNTSSNKTIVYFHIGRGGRFNNQGHKSFNGEKNILQVLSDCDNSGQLNFIHERDEKGRFCSPYYADCNGGFLISVKDANTGVGSLDWDGDYDSDYCQYLSECNENELNLILESNEWNAIRLVEEFFNECTDLNVDWKRFQGNYDDLITVYFNFSAVDLDEFY